MRYVGEVGVGELDERVDGAAQVLAWRLDPQRVLAFQEGATVAGDSFLQGCHLGGRIVRIGSAIEGGLEPPGVALDQVGLDAVVRAGPRDGGVRLARRQL